MIRITVELVPLGIESRARVIARGTITNDGTGSPKLGNYRYRLSKQGTTTALTRAGDIKDFPRLRKNVWHLLRLVLNSAFK